MAHKHLHFDTVLNFVYRKDKYNISSLLVTSTAFQVMTRPRRCKVDESIFKLINGFLRNSTWQIERKLQLAYFIPSVLEVLNSFVIVDLHNSVLYDCIGLCQITHNIVTVIQPQKLIIQSTVLISTEELIRCK